MPLILLKIPYVQHRVSSIASTELSGYLGVPVKVGNVSVGWFNRVVLDDLYLEDQDGQVLLDADHVAAGFEAFPLLKGKFVFTSVRLFGFSVNMKKKTPDAPLNLQFVIDAFASKDTLKKNMNIDLRFNSVMIRRGNIRYDIESAASTTNGFNASHIDIRNLSAKISLKAFNKDSLNASIKKMSFDEASGFRLDRLSMDIISGRDSAFIKNFEIKLPQTSLKISRAKIDMREVRGASELLDRAPVELSIAPSGICLKDLAPFVPSLGGFNETVELSAEAAGFINDINLRQLTLRLADKMLFVGKMDLKGISHPEKAHLFGQVNKMYITTEGLSAIVNGFNRKPTALPAPVKRIGTINFTGEISGTFDRLVASGKFSSAVGSVQTDMVFGSDKEHNVDAYLKGKVSTSGLHLDELFDKGNPYGTARLSLSLDARRHIGSSFVGDVKASIDEFEYKRYKYENILLSGSFGKNSFDGLVQMDDPNGRLQAEGLFRGDGKNSAYNFTARVEHLRPDSLHLTDRYVSPDISLSLNADFTGNSIDNLEGSITVDSLSFLTTPSSFFLKELRITAEGRSEDRKLTVASDIVNGEVSGAYSFSTIVPSLMNTFKGYVPALINATQKKKTVEENNFSLLLTIENTEDLSETLKLPIAIVSPSRITGYYNNIYNKFRLEAYLPQFRIGKTLFESGRLTCENPHDAVDLWLQATNYNKKGLRNYLDLKADARDNRINTSIGWANNKERMFRAELSAMALFTEEEQEEKKPPVLRTDIAIRESRLVLNDSLWIIHPSDIVIKDGQVGIHRFHVGNEKQSLLLDGNISRDPTDTLLLDLKQIELKHIFDILNIPVLQFAGKATGTFNISDLYGSRVLNTDLEITDFSFNQTPLGRLNLFSEWDDEQQGILMLGSIYKNDTTWTDVSGYIFPVGKDAGLSLFFGANDINLEFLHPFVDKVAKGMRGRGFGNVHLHGPFKALTVEGDAYVMDGGLGIDYTNTYYTFSDSIHLDAGSIRMRDVKVSDEVGNTGTVNMTVRHNHFKDVSFDANVRADNMLVFNATRKQNPLFYGKVFGSGTASIYGNDKLVNLDVNIQNNKGTALTLDFINNTTAADYDFITFVDKRQQRAAATDTASAPKDSIKRIAADDGAEMRMNFLLDITPEAKIDLIMDPVSGDKISGNCSGSLQMEYGTKTDLRMYGNVDITEGNYNFSLQQIIHKDFKIREGSSINFRGDPFDATVGINAIYNVTANIRDLDESLALESPRTSIPVNCVLKLDGMLRNPTISFDLELPSSNEEIERQAKALVDTEDMMTRQIIYLLVLSKFYTPEYSQNAYRSSEFSAVASSAISSQLSSILNSLTDKVQIGTNIRTSDDGIQDTEVEMLLSSQLLDNRLLFNGSFGYKNNTYQGKNDFVGEFDLEYKLTPSGEIRLKAYNHANDLYKYLNRALTTQGVGIMFRKDFSRLSDFFRRRRKLLPDMPLAPVSTPSPAATDSISVNLPR